MGAEPSKEQELLSSKESTNEDQTSNRIGEQVVNENQRTVKVENLFISFGNNVPASSLYNSRYEDPNYLVQENWEEEILRQRVIERHQQSLVETALGENISPEFIYKQMLLLKQCENNAFKNWCQQEEKQTASGDPCQQKKAPKASVSSLPNPQFGNPDKLVQINLQQEEPKKSFEEYHQQKDMETASTKNWTTDFAEFIHRQKLLLAQYRQNIPEKQCQLTEMTTASGNHASSVNNSQYGNSDYLIQRNLQEKENLKTGLKEQRQPKFMETGSTKHSTRTHSVETPESAKSMYQQKQLLIEQESKSYQQLFKEQCQQNLSEENHQLKVKAEQCKETFMDKRYQNSFGQEKHLKNIFEKQSQEMVSEKESQENELKELRQKEYMKQIMELHNLSVTQTKCLGAVDSRRLSHAVLRLHLATNWNEMPPNKTFMRIVIQEDSDEFRTVKNCFKSTTLKTFHVVKIERVQNPFLLGCYMLKKLELENMFGAHNVNEMILFRGSYARFIDNICENNFNWKFHADSGDRGCGKGIYFSPISFYANNYANKNTTKKMMFLVRVLASKITEGNRNMEIPPPVGRDTGNNNSNNILRFDTTKRPDGKIIVKYSDNDFYPEYLIHYTVESQPEMK